MSDIMKVIKAMSGECSCGRVHETAVKDVRIGSGLVSEVGNILRENGFPKKLLLVADRNTIEAARGIEESLGGFDVEYKIYDFIRVAEMHHVRELEDMIAGRDIGILSVGTGSVNDPCRLASARQGKKLCIFATAPSMDGFASDTSPIVDGGFKSSYVAKSPEVIIGDTKILAAAPSELKSAGFGDMIAKYIGLVDWKISNILTGELYCEKVADLTRSAVDELMSMAHLVTVNDEVTAGKIFEALLKTGIAMSFMKNSRPASGSEHIIAHLIECVQLRDGIIPNYHGDDVGVCTLEMLKFYGEIASMDKPSFAYENVDFDDVLDFYGNMREDVYKANFPDNIVDGVTPEKLDSSWEEIVKAIGSVPSYEVCKEAMTKAGCKMSHCDIGKPRELIDNCIKYSPFMRRRLTLLRLRGMLGV